MREENIPYKTNTNMDKLKKSEYNGRMAMVFKLKTNNKQGKEMNTITFKNMSTIERLQAMEALWDSLLYEDGEIDTPKWHKEIIDERKRRIENGKAEFIPIAKLKASHK